MTSFDEQPSFVTRWFRQTTKQDTPLPVKEIEKLVQTSTFYTFPVELVEAIIFYMDVATRASLMQTCHRFRIIIEPYLFERVDTTKKPYGAQQIFRTLANRPDLARMVTTISGALYVPSKWHYILGYISPESRTPHDVQILEAAEVENIIILHNLLKALSNTTKVRSLMITDWSGGSKPNTLYDHLIPILSKMDLMELSLEPQFWPRDIAPALRSWSNLTHLHIEDYTLDFGTLLPTDMPNLEYLKAELKYAKWIIPGRPVQTYVSTSAYDIPLTEWKGSIESIALSTGPITTLTFPINWYRPRLSVETAEVAVVGSYIGRYLPSIRRLNINSSPTGIRVEPDRVCADARSPLQRTVLTTML